MVGAVAGGPRVVYLDYNATAPLRPEAFEAMLPFLTGEAGNAASPHVAGRSAAQAVEHARRQVAEVLGCSPGELVFTSGATEANNLALHATLDSRSLLVISAVEHPAVLETARACAAGGTASVVVGVDSQGLLDLDALRAALAENAGPAVVSVMGANNETGVLTDLEAVVAIAHEADALVHTDATQLVGRLPVDVSQLDVDLLSLSAHKFGGPQGVGVLFVRRGAPIPVRPLLHGGGHERGWRSGTLNVAGIVGAGAAAAAAGDSLTTTATAERQLRNRLEGALVQRVPGTTRNGHLTRRLPNVSNLTFHCAPADAVLAAMPTVAASHGSACSWGAPTPSHVLLAMGVSRDDAECSLRFSLGPGTTDAEIDEAIEATATAVDHVRSGLGMTGLFHYTREQTSTLATTTGGSNR